MKTRWQSVLFSCLLFLTIKTVIANEPVSVLVIGDSLSAAYGLPEEQGWVMQLQQKLDPAKAKLVFINDSISGDTSSGGVGRTVQMTDRHSPDWVIIALGANDGLRGGSPKLLRQNLLSMIDAAELSGAKAILLGMQMPPNYGPAYTKAFTNAFTQAAAQKKVPLLPFFIDGVGGIAGLNQPDGVHPTAEGQLIIRDTICRFLAQTTLLDDAEIQSNACE